MYLRMCMYVSVYVRATFRTLKDVPISSQGIPSPVQSSPVKSSPNKLSLDESSSVQLSG